MQLKLSAVGSTFTALRRRALVAGALVATCGLVACGSDEKQTTTGTGTGTTTGGTTTAGTTGTTTASGTSTGSTTAAASCELSHSASLTPKSDGIVMTAKDGTTTPMPNMLFVVSANPTDPKKKFAVSVFDYDYCDFAYDHGYSLWPTTGFNAGSFYLVDSSGNGNTLSAGDYTNGSGAQSIYITTASGSFGSGVTKEAVGKAVGGGSCNATFPTITTAKVTLNSAFTAGTTAVTGVTGTIDATLSDESTIKGTFSSGNCTASPTTEQINALPKPDTCACSLSSGTSGAAATPGATASPSGT